MFRFLGSTKIPLRDLSSGQVRSLPSRNVPLVNESGQNIGVSLTNTRNYKTISFKKPNNNASNLFISGYNQPYDWLWSSSQCYTGPQRPSSRRCHNWCWYCHLNLKWDTAVGKSLLRVESLILHHVVFLLIRRWRGEWYDFTRWGPKWLYSVPLIPRSAQEPPQAAGQGTESPPTSRQTSGLSGKLDCFRWRVTQLLPTPTTLRNKILILRSRTNLVPV